MVWKCVNCLAVENKWILKEEPTEAHWKFKSQISDDRRRFSFGCDFRAEKAEIVSVGSKTC